ncbi:hypothetical protein [Bacillus methanolicus]|uniref:hypothetical protein n=1 Tax=Bacillus methanolicus TaxID=1471 RepID=UPI000570F9AA|nr:hypothetical protein [Bacillus methanolicus]
MKTEQTKASTFKSGGDRLASKGIGASSVKVLKDFDRRSEMTSLLKASPKGHALRKIAMKLIQVAI